MMYVMQTRLILKLIEVGVDHVCDVGGLDDVCDVGDAKDIGEMQADLDGVCDVEEVDVDDVGDAKDVGVGDVM